MFKRGGRRSSSFGRRRKTKKISPWAIAVAVPVVFLGLEITARVGEGFLPKETDSLSQEAIAHSLKFVDEDGQTFDGLDNRGELLATESLATAYELVGNQTSEFYSLNDQGFRDDEPLPLEKPQGEIRVFILGNSAAFGRGVQNNDQTLAAHLERRLQSRVQQQRQSPASYRPDVFPFFQPSREKLMGMSPKIKEGNYRVINVAVPGYSSGNELAQFALEILPYNPDLVVLLNGYEDLLLPAEAEATEIPTLTEFAKDPDRYFQDYLWESLGNKAKKSALVRVIADLTTNQKPTKGGEVLSIREQNQQTLAQHLPESEEAFQGRLARYNQNIKQILSLCSAARIPLVVALQPEITGREAAALDPSESQILQGLSGDYIEKVQSYYPQMIESVKQIEKAFPTNIKTLDFYRLNDKFTSPVFVDPIHFNEAAHDQMAEQLYTAIANLEKMQIIPENYYLD